MGIVFLFLFLEGIMSKVSSVWKVLIVVVMKFVKVSFNFDRLMI